MATLRELSASYRDAAVLLQVQLREERRLARQGDGAAAGRAQQLSRILTELRELRRLCEHYYDKPRDPRWRI